MNLFALVVVIFVLRVECSSQPRTGFNVNDPSQADLVLRTLPPTVNRVAVVPADDNRVMGTSPCHAAASPKQKTRPPRA